MNQSEQVLSLVEIGTVPAEDGCLAVAGGVLVQALPKPQTGAIHEVAERAQELPPVEAMLQAGLAPEEVLARLFAGIPTQVLERRPLRFACRCRRERAIMALNALDEGARVTLLAEGEATVDCPFCHEQYRFDGEELARLWQGGHLPAS